MRSLLSTTLIAVLFSASIMAFETDQFNLPPVPLADIGDEVSLYFEQNLEKAIDDVNLKIAAAETCLARSEPAPKSCRTTPATTQLLDRLRSNDGIAHAVFKRLGDGNLVITTTGRWFNEHKFSTTPDRYKPPFAESYYVFKPITYSTMSPTIRMFGVEFGIDKLEHFFQQGYRYYEIRQKQIAGGMSPRSAEKAAIAWGQRTERTYYGLLTSGVYSNADLYANFAGMRFYEMLSRGTSIDGKEIPPLVILRDGRWQKNNEAELRHSLIKPFITLHLNEAHNPSGYAFNLYPTVKRVVREYSCPKWRAARTLQPAVSLRDLSANYENWNGEEYGFTRKGRIAGVMELCFGQW